ncbi:MAG: hypothetical protein RLZZ546_1981 [Bacteroidota bacterium]
MKGFFFEFRCIARIICLNFFFDIIVSIEDKEDRG